MIEYNLSADDLAEIRFGISPLNELGLSLRALRDPGRFPLHIPWLRYVDSHREDLDLDVLWWLADERLWVPDFLTPVPTSPMTRIEDELRALAATPPEVVDHDLDAVHLRRPPSLSGPAQDVLHRIVSAVTTYWDVGIQPWWPRMRAVLEADIVFRGRTIAQSGLTGMFADLGPAITFDGRVVRAAVTAPCERRVDTDGRGLTLTPSLFTRRVSAPVSGAGAPFVIYAARGLGTLWQGVRPCTSRALVGLIGRPRAELLVVLEHPGSSTELAERLGVSASAVNQHLRAMRDAGLLNAARHGRSMLYGRTELGAQLAAATVRVPGTPGS